MKHIFDKQFRIPIIIGIGILVFLLLNFLNLKLQANILAILITILGSYTLFIDMFKELLKKHFGLDYIAIVAIIVSLITGQFLVAIILALMISSGKTLEDFAGNQAKKYLTKLIERIPDEVLLWENNGSGNRVKIENVKINQEIFIRKGEVIPLDGILSSKNGLTDESSLTGEPYFLEKVEGDQIRSGTVNVGNPIVIKVNKTSQNSTYNKIVELVKKAQSEKSPLIRLADKYSNFFTIVTFSLAGIAYVTSGYDLIRVLAVLAIATPCPLIIATPVALLGGVNSAAKKQIIVKKLSAIELLSKVTTIVFDKTGTLTIGKPKVTEIEITDKKYPKSQILSISAALERNSLHPLAKTIVDFAKMQKAPVVSAQHVEEIIGKGISGKVKDENYTLSKVNSHEGMIIELKTTTKRVALFRFEDELRDDSKQILLSLKNMGLSLNIFTGDKKLATEKIATQLGIEINIKSDMSPEDKHSGIKTLQKSGEIVAMVGDGINDAPALAMADVGLVFARDEQTASSEAADIVFLGRNFTDVFQCLKISRRTINIAKQSIVFGISLSIIGMVFATFGFVSPIYGAGLQEVIDVVVILNAVRASF